MYKKILYILFVFAFSLLPFLSQTPVSAASDFKISSQYIINLEKGKDYVTVTDRVVIEVVNPNYFYQSGIVQYFSIPDFDSTTRTQDREYKLKNMSVKNQYGAKINYTVEKGNDGLTIKVVIPSRVDSSTPYTLTLTYKTKDLINISGNITNMYVPALPKDIVYKETGKYGLTTDYTYSTKLILPPDMPTPSYTQPSTLKPTKDSKNVVFNISSKQREGQTVWIQFGSKQYYKFKIVQNAPKTDNITPLQISDIAPISSLNVYKIALPREYDETGQKIYISSINPAPKYMERDSEGNLIASFEVPANQDSKIEIEGIISLESVIEEIENISMEQYLNDISSLPNKSIYTSEDTYWEISDEVVKEIAQGLLTPNKNIMDVIEADYKYIIDKFVYSKSKLEQGNLRVGAKAALSGSQTICMEYSDSLVAILRAQGIPSRVAIGYGNDPTGVENDILNTELSKQTIGHQWAQVWIPNYGWLSLDPTWGETGRKYVGRDLDHILWYTIGSSSQAVADTTLYSADKLSNSTITTDEVWIQALTESQFNTQKEGAKGIEEVIYEYNSKDSVIGFFVKTTLLGRILVYLIPILVTISISLFITSIVFAIIRRKSKVSINQ